MAIKDVSIGGLQLQFAALTFRQLNDHKDDINTLMSPAGANFANAEARGAIIRVALVSIKSPITEDALLDAIDTANFTDLITAIFDRNGFLAKADDPGEAVAAASQS